MNNSLYLRRQKKILVPPPDDGPSIPPNYVAAVVKNIEPLGYVFSEPLIEACRRLSLDQLTDLYHQLIVNLKQGKGAHRKHRPMYPNFPSQVMEMSQGELYLNAIIHYLSGGRLLPRSQLKERFPLIDATKLEIIKLGSEADFERLFGQIISSNTSLSEQDREDVEWFVRTYGDGIERLLPERVPQKENMAFLAGLLLRHTTRAFDFLQRYCRTATDVLRLAVALSDGDLSLATGTRFRSFARAERRLLLGLVDQLPQPVEDMLRWKGRWVRLGERLHPGEYANAFPRAAEAFGVLRNDLPYTTFNSQVEQALVQQDVAQALRCLKTRPGFLARRLDHLLRANAPEQDAVLEAFAERAPQVSTPVLLQVRQHFRARSASAKLRVFFPKGSLARAYGIPNELPPLSEQVASKIVNSCELTLIERFGSLPSLGKVYVDPTLRDFLIPHSARSASRSYRTAARGSRLPLPSCKTLRFFVWWKNGQERTDIDLSAVLLDEDFNYVDVVSYYNLKNYGGCHSGDIVNAPKGASEFIDITLDKVLERNVRYVVMTLHSFTQQPYCELPECFAGWMARAHANSGEIYEPRAVQDRLDLTADTRVAIPLVMDVLAEKVIWCDIALRGDPNWCNNVHTTFRGINVTVRALTELNKPNLYDLFRLHALARGELVETPELAETVFSVENGTPFRQEEIASGYMQ